ncbi:hypothetical protein ACQY74_000191 (plasmid) [Rhizobium leguminosarum bv. trifolii]
MDRWQAMRIFVKVAETESFADTARQMFMSAPAVTRAVASLEDLIGARLLVRTTRSVKMTEAGVRYFEDCRRILADIAEAEAAAGGSYATPTGTLSITASALFGQMYVLPIVTSYLDTYATMKAKTLFIDRPVNIVEEGIDVAVRIGHLPDSNLSARSEVSVASCAVRQSISSATAFRIRRTISKTTASLHRQRHGLHLSGNSATICAYPWMRLCNATRTKQRYSPRVRDGA